MRMGIQRPLGIGVAVVATVALVAAAVPATEPVVEPQCVATLNVERLPIQEEPVMVQAQYTEAIGEEVSAAFAPESQVAVLRVEREEDDEPLTHRLTLNTAEAVAGEWEITLRGEAGECAGSVVVGGPEPDRN